MVSYSSMPDLDAESSLLDITINVVSNIEDLNKYSSSWDLINKALPHQNPLMSFEWIVTFIETQIAFNTKWTVFICMSGPKLMAVLPIIIKSTKRFGITYQQAELPFDDQTMSVDMLVSPGFENNLIKPIIKSVYHTHKNVALILFRRIDEKSNVLNAYCSILGSHIEYCESGGSIAIPDDYVSFRNKLAKNFKSNLNKASNKAIKAGGIEFFDDDLDGLSAVEKLKIVCELEHSGWKGRSGSSILSSPKDLDFYQRLVERLEISGMLHFSFLKLGGKVVAGNLGVKHGSKLLLWKLAYDDEYKKYSPGGLLLEKLIEKNVESNEFSIIDLMTGESWYKNWNMNWRRFNNVYLFKFGLIGLYIKTILIAKKITNHFRNN